jgi:hypothetical protein
VINDHFELLGFGVTIVRPGGAPRVEQVLVTEPIEGSRQEIVEASQLGNTRHLSATQFVSDQRDAIALVASQDGRFTVFAWSPLRDIVHARRLERACFRKTTTKRTKAQRQPGKSFCALADTS